MCPARFAPKNTAHEEGQGDLAGPHLCQLSSADGFGQYWLLPWRELFSYTDNSIKCGSRGSGIVGSQVPKSCLSRSSRLGLSIGKNKGVSFLGRSQFDTFKTSEGQKWNSIGNPVHCDNHFAWRIYACAQVCSTRLERTFEPRRKMLMLIMLP